MKRLLLVLFLLFSCVYGDIPSLEKLTKTPAQAWVQQGDRWTFKERFEEEREDIIPLLESMGIFSEKWAQHAHYDYALVLGALHTAVESRMGHLIEEWKRGTRFDQIVFLTGQRPLHQEKEAQFLHLRTETAMMVHVWETLEMPPELRDIPLVVIDAPPLPLRGRPTTESTVYAWLEVNPSPGSVLMVSSQPFIGYQKAILEVLLPAFSIEGVGKEGGRTLPLSVLLDTVGKQHACEALR
ncbi:MAG: hypothetical protein KDK64_06895 [Chlamydiia bacterium]|nr:hypothetical protein [Chlamydiia bacterium]